MRGVVDARADNHNHNARVERVNPFQRLDAAEPRHVQIEHDG